MQRRTDALRGEEASCVVAQPSCLPDRMDHLWMIVNLSYSTIHISPDHTHDPFGVDSDPKKEAHEDTQCYTTHDVGGGMELSDGFRFAFMAFEHDGNDLDIVVQSDGAVQGKHGHQQPEIGVDARGNDIKFSDKSC